jgi:radical SAM superfamily enzyme YgiQ (UPF0313 family)
MGKPGISVSSTSLPDQERVMVDKKNKLDLLLVKPGNQKKIYGDLSLSLSGLEPPLWAALIAAFIRDKGYSVVIIDEEVEGRSPEETAKKIIEYNPSLTAIVVSGTNPSASTMNMSGARNILSALKAKKSSIKTMLCGLHPSALPERTLREEDADLVCQGEGFYTLLDFLAGKDYKEIKGLWYREGASIVSNQRAELIDPNELPMAAWDMLPMAKYRAHNWHCFGQINERSPYAVIYMTLGCPFSCAFCCINALFGERKIRYRDPARVLEEIDYLVKNYAVKNIKILDEMFALDEDRVIETCSILAERGYKLNIWAYARVDTIRQKMLKAMKKAGINWLGIGFESGSERIRAGVSKGRFTDSRIKEVVKMVRAEGIYIGGNFIFGLPDDNMETMQKTLDMAKELNCEYTNFYVAMPYPGSKLYENAVNNKLPLPHDWLGYSQFSYETQPLPTRYLTAAQILQFRDNAFHEFYNSPRYQDMIAKKFGAETLRHVKKMLETRLNRRLLEVA